VKAWAPLSILRAAFPSGEDAKLQDMARRAAGGFALRWQRAYRADPELGRDLIRLGGVLTLQPMTFDNGAVERGAVDPAQLAYEAGRRDMAVTLMAAMGIDTRELNFLLEVANDDR
jgi:hypothetical protein